MLHSVCQRCAQHRLPFQIHTGPWTLINPVDFTSLFQEHPQVTFDIFHGGYPFFRELGLLVKIFPNVYADACWLYSLAPASFRQALNEWIEVVPANKIFVWGGDHWMPIDYSYTTLMLTKKMVAEVMADKVASAYFPMKTALEVPAKIMGENAIRVYGFDASDR